MKKELLTCALAAGLSASASANSYTFQTAAGATESGGNAVSASATFVTSADTLKITLSNLYADPLTVAQNLSDLSFSVLNFDTSGALLTSSSGLERTVASDGTFSDGAVVATGWVLAPAAGSVLLDDLLGGGAGPAHTIIGPPNGANVYATANTSIAGNGPHNPFLAGSATFELSIPGLTADSIINNVIFSFGTARGNNVPGQAPDGGTTALLFGAALSGLGVLRRKLS